MRVIQGLLIHYMKKSWLTTGGDGDNTKRGQSIVGLLGWVGGLCWYRRENVSFSVNLSYICSVDKGCVGGISNPFSSGSGNFPF